MVKIFLKSHMHKAQSQRPYTESTLFPILSLEKLLPSSEREVYLRRIQEIVTLPENYFKAIYEDLIDKFALFVQTLPERYGEELGGLLADGLRRALLAIQIINEKPESKPHPLYTFAVFSIALLSDIGQIIGTYRVMISDDKGVYIDDWYPYLGSMHEFGEYFKMRPYEGTPSALLRGITPLLARQLLSETAITWLASNNQIFDMWLAFLRKGEDWEGGLGKILRLEKTKFDRLMSQEIGIIPPQDVHLFDPLGTEAGEKFLAWLKAGLEDGSISVNQSDSLVHIVPTNDVQLGLFLQAPELFQKFVDVYSKHRDWIVVCRQFNSLGLTKLSGSDVKFEQFFADTQETKSAKLGFLGREKATEGKKLSFAEQGVLPSRMVTTAKNIKEGVVIKDASMIFGGKVPSASTYVHGVEMRWGLENVLPKVRGAGLGPALAPSIQPKRK